MLDELFAGCVTALLAGCAAEDAGAAADDAGSVAEETGAAADDSVSVADEESSLDEEMDGFTEDAGVAVLLETCDVEERGCAAEVGAFAELLAGCAAELFAGCPAEDAGVVAELFAAG